MLKLATITSQCSSPPIQPRRDVKIHLLQPHIQQPAENPYKAVECCSILAAAIGYEFSSISFAVLPFGS